MALVRWNPIVPAMGWSPLREFDTLRQEIDRVFNNFWPQEAMASSAAMWTPRIDLRETEDEYVLQADLPGMKQEDLDIQFQGGMLLLKGERKLERETNNGYHHRERTYGAFARSFTLGTPVEADAISATYKDGVLEVHVPKTAAAKPQRIAIQAS
jgi:HSP20 family protein